MAVISTLEHGTGLDGLDEQCLFTWVRLSEHSLTQALAADFEPLLAEIAATKTDERMLVIRVLKAAAAAQFADDARLGGHAPCGPEPAVVGAAQAVLWQPPAQ